MNRTSYATWRTNPTKEGDRHFTEVRFWGKWVSRPGEEDDDHARLSLDSQKELDRIFTALNAKWNPKGVHLDYSPEEKFWLSVYATARPTS
jgi:hypothetical protein